MGIHLKCHATQLKQLTQRQTCPLHDLNGHKDPPKSMKATIFQSNEYTSIINSEHVTPNKCKEISNTLTLPPPHNTFF